MYNLQPYLVSTPDFFRDRTFIKIVKDIFLDEQGREVNPNTLRYTDGTLYTKDLICKGRLVRKKTYFNFERGLFSLKGSGFYLDGCSLSKGTKKIIRLLEECQTASEHSFANSFFFPRN